MRTLSNLGIGLSIVFGFFLFALVAEIYYLLWWKKRFTNRDIEDNYSNSEWEFFYLFCRKKSSSLSSTVLNTQEHCNPVNNETEAQIHLNSGSGKDLLLKPFGEDNIDTELMRMHNLAGPPRFLFTIKEETKEDLESEDGKSRERKSLKGSRGRSLSDVLREVETPLLTPLASPPFLTPHSFNYHGFNPLFELSTEEKLNRMRSSPPPKFKFLRDAEEKLYRRKLMEEDKKKVDFNGGSVQDHMMNGFSNSLMVTKEDDGPVIRIVGA